MPRPGPPSTAAEHEQHDRLLVSQLVAGDPLEATQRLEAQQLVSGCAACASLAADLRMVSGLVAQEPVPRRRHDFRIDAEQAQQLRGNALTRFVRGLSLPRSRAWQPAAAGIMSIGLVFVVAGYAWPDGGTVPVVGDTNAVPAPIELRPPGTIAPAIGALPKPAPTSRTDVQFRALEEPAFEEPAIEAPADDEAAAQLREGNAKSLAGADEDQIVESDGAAGLAADTFFADGGLEEVLESERSEAAAPEAEARVGQLDDLDVAEDAAAPPEAEARVGQLDDLDVAENAAAPELTSPSVVADPADDDSGLESVLVAIGAILALAGGLLLLLAWLSRRTADPLLR